MVEIFSYGRRDLSEHASKKSFTDMRTESPYRKPTQVGWRKYAKVNE